MKPCSRLVLPLLVLLGAGATASPALAQQILQYGFEGRDPIWIQGPSDTRYRELTHAILEVGQEKHSAHGGQRSEYFQPQAESGSFIYYGYPIGRAPVNDDLTVSLFVRANRPGAQLLCRVILPHERDPANPDRAQSVLLRGDTYQLTGRWSRLQIPQPVKHLQEQAQLLRVDRKRDILTADAYVDQVLINLYSGPGPTEVWTDDLEVGPVLDAQLPGAPGSPTRTNPGGTRPSTRTTPGTPVKRSQGNVQFDGGRLLYDGQPWFPIMIRYSGAPIKVLREGGINTVVVDETAPPGLIENALRSGLVLMPTLRPPDASAEGDGPGTGRDVPGQLTSMQVFGTKVSQFLEPAGDSLLCWNLGSNLSDEQFPAIDRAAQALRSVDPTRPLAVDIVDGFGRLKQGFGGQPLLLGVHRWPLQTSLELAGYREWLVQRRRLAPADTFCWTWIQTHAPDWFTTVAYDRQAGSAAPPAEPPGAEPDQIRLMTYMAIASGYRGLGYWSDRSLADPRTGSERLLGLALLNSELKLLEPLLATADKEPDWIETLNSDVKAAVLRTDKAILVLPIWMGSGSQMVVPQGATFDLTLTVPQVPGSYQAWEVSPAWVHAYKAERVLGGMKVHLRNFGLTSALVFTADLDPRGLVVRFQDLQRYMCRSAAQWQYDLAQAELNRVVPIHAALVQAGQKLQDAEPLLAKARASLQAALQHRRYGMHRDAYNEAQTALRCLRTLEREHWEEATRMLDTPVASPYAVSFATLPRHLQMVSELKRMKVARNVLPDGDFELAPDRVPAGWLEQEVPTLDDVDLVYRRVAEKPHAGKQCLMLHIEPKNKLLPPPHALERTFLAIHSPAVKLPPGSWVRVSAWVRVEGGIGASADGALFYDSAGGEALGVRVTGSTSGWKQYRLYRKVPADGKVFLTVALTGLGSVYFDDLLIEPLVADPSAPAAAPLERIASGPGRPLVGVTAAAPVPPVSAMPVSQQRSPSPYVPPASGPYAPRR